MELEFGDVVAVAFNVFNNGLAEFSRVPVDFKTWSEVWGGVRGELTRSISLLGGL